MQISLTGNPFVDTGLGVISSLSGCDDINNLDTDHMHQIHGNGELLAHRNSRLRSTSMIFGTNSLVLQNQIQYENRILYYSKMTTALLNKIGLEDVNEICESCGNHFSLNLDELFKQILVPLGYSEGKRYIGRDWFPLAGSIGNDAQALPAASRTPNLCAKCLFAVHYLPLGVILIDRKLAVFQSTSKRFWYSLVGEVARQVEERVSANNFDTIGRGEGNAAAVERILNVMQNIHDEDLEPDTSVFVWKFSNFGAGPDCRIEEIPNAALHFLHEAVRHVSRNEIRELVLKDRNNNPAYSLLNCISKGLDYSSLYPYKKYNGVSTKLFSIYQILIHGITFKSLNTAFKISKYIAASTNERIFESIGKDLDEDFGKQNTVRKLIVQMVNEDQLTSDEYSELFLSDVERVVRLKYSAWKLIKYYMHNLAAPPYLKIETNDTLQVNVRLIKIRYTGSIIFNSLLEEKGKDRFYKEILNGFANGEVGVGWLRRQFVKLGSRYEGFTYKDWKDLCIDNRGRESPFELLFTFRIMWTEWFRKGLYPIIIDKLTNPSSASASSTVSLDSESIKLDSDLSAEQELMVTSIVGSYIEHYGFEKFQKYVIGQLINSGPKSIYWFREQLSKYDKNFENDDYWENMFLSDLNGNSAKMVKLFQLHLLLTNSLRDYLFKAESKVISSGNVSI